MDIFSKLSPQEVGQVVDELAKAVERRVKPTLSFLLRVKAEEREEVEARAIQLVKSLSFFTHDLKDAVDKYLQMLDRNPHRIFDGAEQRTLTQLVNQSVNHLNEVVRSLEIPKGFPVEPLEKVVATFSRLSMAGKQRVLDPVALRQDLTEAKEILSDPKVVRNILSKFVGKVGTDVVAYKVSTRDYESILVFCREHGLTPLFLPLYAQAVLRMNEPFSARKLATSLMWYKEGNVEHLFAFWTRAEELLEKGASTTHVHTLAQEYRLSPYYPVMAQVVKALYQAERAFAVSGDDREDGIRQVMARLSRFTQVEPTTLQTKTASPQTFGMLTSKYLEAVRKLF